MLKKYKIFWDIFDKKTILHTKNGKIRYLSVKSAYKQILPNIGGDALTLFFINSKIRKKSTEMREMSVKIIDLKANVLDDNNVLAQNTRERLKKEKTFLLNLMSAPGSGKTTTLTQLIKALKGEYKIGVMEADIDSDVDAVRITEAGAAAVQLHTGGMCHLDADMTAQGLDSIVSENFDIVILENVGNLVCPAEFDTGAVKNAMILSVPEGDDKPLKYPLMFQTADVVVINKTDVAPYFDFDMEKAKKNIESRHPGIPVIPLCAKTGDGVDKLADWLKTEAEAFFVD